MTALPQEELFLTPEEYLALEEASDIKHEYANGYIQAMAGASRAHNIIASNILITLGVQLRGQPCVPLGSDMRLAIRQGNEIFYYYPDVTVDCSGRDTKETEEPSVIFEVLSARTARSDEGEKLINYLNLPSMRVYVLVDQRRVHLTVHRRSPSGEWRKETLEDAHAVLLLPEIGCTIPVRAIYERLPFVA